MEGTYSIYIYTYIYIFKRVLEGGYFKTLRRVLKVKTTPRFWNAFGSKEMFLNQDDFLAFSHRLNVMTYQALEDLVLWQFFGG